jgi:hypothetical protein
MSAPLASSKVLLVADPRAVPARSSAVPIRRYRLARLRLDRDAAGHSRYEYLKRVYD